MKRIPAGLLALVLVFLCLFSAGAEGDADLKSGDYLYRIQADGTAMITRYKGDHEDLFIPSELDGVPVTTIGPEAFKSKNSLMYVTLPESIKEIGDSAFMACGNLMWINIPDAVKRSVYVDTVAEKFRIESDILFDRIRRTREKTVDEERAQARREAARREYGERPAGPEAAASTYTPPVNELRALETQNPILAPSERELLGFILTDGCTRLVFESDSEFYDPEGAQTVAEFIDAAFAADGIRFANDAYRLTYDAYFALYDEGMAQEEIVRSLLNGEEDTVRFVTSQLSDVKYELSVKLFQAALTTRESWLTNFVPKAILAYHDKRLQSDQQALLRELASAGADRQREILTSLERINTLKKRINIKLGRLK